MDQAMKYEELLCKLFNCNQDKDPLQYASTSVYDIGIMEIEEGKGYELRAGIFSALRKFQLTYVEGRYNTMEDFNTFWEEVDYWIEITFKTNKIEDINRTIDTLDNLLKEIQREN